MDKLSLIRTFLEERLGALPEQVTPEANLKDLGVDSLMLLELLFEFEEKLDIKLSKDVATPATVRDLIAIVEQLQTSKAES